ncbi:MAG: sodium/glutamate symporter [Turneriella sp.]
MQYFLLVLFFLGLSVFLGKQIPWFSRYRIPPSLTAGTVALLLFTAIPGSKNSDFFLHLKQLPSEFIALVFACFFLQRHEHTELSERRITDIFAQTSLIWVSVMGQVLIGLVATILIYKPFFGQPLAFTSVLEAGFAGGHGTAVAMGPILVQNGVPAGLEYALFSATIGLLGGIVGGVLLIERQRRKTRMIVSDKDLVHAQFDITGLLTSLGLVAAAYWLGLFYKGAFETEILPRITDPAHLDSFRLPLFAYTLLGGYTVKQLLTLSGFSRLIDNSSILLLADVFLEILIFSGIAIIDVRLLGQGLIPLLSLFALGFAWNLFCHIWLRPRILNKAYSFELGLINFGMLNGTAATGLMLLKMVDPKFQTPAAKVFAESSAITQPFIAGGILTFATPYIVSQLSPALSVLLYSGLLAVWLVLGLAAGKKIRNR